MTNIKMGKNIIDNLTTGMYEDSRIIYREYIQNSTDAIDKAIKNGIYADGEEPKIEIQIDEEKRIIKIKDNGIGIPKNEVHSNLANIADSKKEKGVERGFRGIGRLGGLAYCEKLRFITSFKGEDIKTIMTWDAKKCRTLVEDINIHLSAEEIFNQIITYEQEECDINKHFFIVELINVNKENKELLNVDDKEKGNTIKEYIQWTAPVGYKKFIFKSKIKDFAEKNNFKISEYNISLDGEDMYKNYGTMLYNKASSESKSKVKYDEIYDLQFKIFKNVSGEILAWMWYGISAFDKQIPSVNDMRGIRLRKENIQIGGDSTLSKLFKEDRANYYFVGEVHAVHKDLIPNARRDYFNENGIRNQFEEELKCYFAEILHKIYTLGNKVKNNLKRETEYRELEKDYEQKNKEGFINLSEKENFERNIEKAKQKWEKASQEVERIKERTKNNEALSRVIEELENKHNTNKLENKNTNQFDNEKLDNKEKKENLEEKDNENKKDPLLTDRLSKLNKKERKLVSKIYDIINNALPNEVSRNLIEKIQEELSK